jgi:hypothetical protein
LAAAFTLPPCPSPSLQGPATPKRSATISTARQGKSRRSPSASRRWLLLDGRGFQSSDRSSARIIKAGENLQPGKLPACAVQTTMSRTPASRSSPEVIFWARMSPSKRGSCGLRQPIIGSSGGRSADVKAPVICGRQGWSTAALDLPTQCRDEAFCRGGVWDKLLIGERAGARTQDPVIKSHVLYRLSYALPWPLMASEKSPSSSVIWKSMSCRHVDASVAEKPAVSGSCFRPGLCRGMGRRGQ